MNTKEQYEISQDTILEPSIKFQTFSELVANRHERKYGIGGRDEIRRATYRVFKEALQQLSAPDMSNNILLVGKVQSGKTSNLEALTALAFDNDFNLMIIYGGYDNNLLDQTTSRFKETFGAFDDLDEILKTGTPAGFSTSAKHLSITDIDNDLFEELHKARVPIIITAMKRPKQLKRVNAFLKRIDRTLTKALIIDDEGDQASLNICRDKVNDASATYAQICEMKQLLGDPLYFSVTATPHANIFLSAVSALRPDSIHLLYPGKGYCGAESYRPDSNLLTIIPDDISDYIDIDKIAPSLRRSLYYFIVASAIMRSRNLMKSDMIIHAFRETKHHEKIFNWVTNFVEQSKFIFKEDNADEIQAFLSTCETTFRTEFSAEVQDTITIDELQDHIKEVIKWTHIVLRNSGGKHTQSKAQVKRNIIHIGGDLLQRGITIENLVTTYFTRWPKDGGNMDTNLQRARWFGYRKPYLDLCRVFTTSEISDELFALAEVDENLWDQFEEIESGEKGIRDVIVEAGSTRERPTRRQAADYRIVHFRSNWIKQKNGVFERHILASNNDYVENLLKGLTFSEGCFGSAHTSKATCSFTYAPTSQIIAMFESLEGIFDDHSFSISDIRRVLTDEEIPIIKMSHFDTGRKRSFYSTPNSMLTRIKALHQGADSSIPEEVDYQGDKYVLADRSRVNLQIFKIIPLHENAARLMDTQYMFALYVPSEKAYYIPEWSPGQQ